MDLFMAAEDDWGVGLCLHYIAHATEEGGDHSTAAAIMQRSMEVAREAGDPHELAVLTDHLATSAFSDGDVARARSILKESLPLFEKQGSDYGVVKVLNVMAYISTLVGDYADARTTALAIQKAPGGRQNIAIGAEYLGQIDYLQGRLLEARAHFEAALKIFRELTLGVLADWVLPWLACVYYRLGQLDRAQALIEESQVIKGPEKDWSEIRLALLVRGDLARVRGDTATAAEFYVRSLKVVVKYHLLWDAAERLEAIAKLASANQKAQRAARLFGAAAALRDQNSTPVPLVEQADYDTALVLARGQLEAPDFQEAWDEGRQMGWEQAAAYALSDVEP
jgi:tetratricopeptide (TPR) repeat protein